MTADEIHTQVTAEEIAHVFEGEEKPADLSHFAIEDWVTQKMSPSLPSRLFRLRQSSGRNSMVTYG